MEPPEGWSRVAANPGWWLKDGADAGNELNWLPEGYVADPHNPGWYYLEGSDASKEENWRHDATVEEPTVDVVDWWTTDEVAQAAQVAGANGRNVEANWPKIAAAMQEWELVSPLVGVGIIGTIAQESGGFAPVEEAWWLSPSVRLAYYNNVGTGPGQHAAYGGGVAYHGRCFVQLTHVSNYQQASDAINLRISGMGLDLVGQPDQALDPNVAAHIICWFFASKGLVPYCEQMNWQEVRRRVWGGNGDTVGIGKLVYAASVLVPLAQERGYL